MKSPAKKVILIVLGSIIGFMLIIALFVIANQYIITTSEYTFESDRATSEVKIAVISDLHNMNFLNKNKVIADKIETGNPDLIAIVGDMIDGSTDNAENTLNAITPLPDIAPTYYCIGNSEKLFSDYDNYIKTVQEAGVTVLDDKVDRVNINGNDITLLGLSSYSFGDVENPAYTALVKELCENDTLRILLCHYPEYSQWFFGRDLYYEFDFELMLSGHTHGGLVRLPKWGAVFAPQQGWFPEYSKGLYYVDRDNKNPYHMLVTAGLGPDKRFVRLNNFPEVSFVTIKPEK
ncbi:MAG: metallophosphoesterase [Acutalibacteraceae bacterium]|nr:metallophosphoesterase [Acutalibacteraceae bacterium]